MYFFFFCREKCLFIIWDAIYSQSASEQHIVWGGGRFMNVLPYILRL